MVTGPRPLAVVERECYRKSYNKRSQFRLKDFTEVFRYSPFVVQRDNEILPQSTEGRFSSCLECRLVQKRLFVLDHGMRIIP